MHNTIPLPLATTLDHAAKNLVEFGFTRFIYPSLPGRFSETIRAFAHLVESADATLVQINDPRELHQDGKSNLGLQKTTRGARKLNPRPDEVAEGRTEYDETKFYYHGNQRTLGYFANRTGVVDRHKDFFLQTACMLGESIVLGLELADRMDRLLPGYNFAKRMSASEGEAVLRLLRYLCDGNRPNIAQMHRDQNLLTVHIRSDRPQLWLADKEGRVLSDLQETRDDSVLIFLCRKAWEITRGVLPGILHGVLDPTFGSVRTPRHTAVSFLHGAVTQRELDWASQNINLLRPPKHLSDYSRGNTAT